MDDGAWVDTYRGTVFPWETDIVEHLTVAYYFERFADATLNLLHGLGLGAGYVRALHDDRILVDEGVLWHAGGGVNVILRSSPGTALGLRLDGRALFQSGVVTDGIHASPLLGASAFLRF